MCIEVAVLLAATCRSARPSGPIFLSQARSIRCRAMFCPFSSRFLDKNRCTRGLKYPNMEEKFIRGLGFGWVRAFVMFESSRARTIPRIVTRMAAVLAIRGMVIGGVLAGVMKEVMIIPAIMLPRASRVNGAVISGLFSFIDVIGGTRVRPAWTRMVMRML